MRSTLKSLLVPGGLFFVVGAAVAHAGWISLTPPALTFLSFCALLGGMLLAWRFHSSRIFLSLVLLLLVQQALAPMGQRAMSPSLALHALALLVPINLVLIALMSERGLTKTTLAPITLLLFVESVFVAVLSQISDAARIPSPRIRHMPAEIAFPSYVTLVFAAAAVFLLLRFFMTRKPVDAAFFWSLGAMGMSIRFLGSAYVSSVYSSAAACIFAASLVESSYLLAYQDELTGLPSRRAFNRAMLLLQSPYTIAAVDIDHFKRFNDTYGHDTGDEVLRLVASNLVRVTGGGQAYRCGGEEFTILFPGKSIAEVVDHLEQLRQSIQASEFRLRGYDRRQTPRGPDRRNSRGRHPISKGHAIRQLAKNPPAAKVSVTVSIGAAEAGEKSLAEAVLQAADKALYQAKENGRNRIETAPKKSRPTRAKTAGIA